MTDSADLEQAYIEAIDQAIINAGRILDGYDLPDDTDDDDLSSIMEERAHCGVCAVRTVMEEVWPKVEAYIDYLKGTSRE